MFTDVEPAIFLHTEEEKPNEAVGLIWADSTITQLINQARSPVRFTVSVDQLGAAVQDRHIRDLVAIYHSHPHSQGQPSPTDIDMMRDMAESPGWEHVASVIFGTDGLRCWIWNAGAKEVPWQISSTTSN